jgi:hypothetical protein
MLRLCLPQGAVATTADGKGMFPENHEQYIGEHQALTAIQRATSLFYLMTTTKPVPQQTSDTLVISITVSQPKASCLVTPHQLMRTAVHHGTQDTSGDCVPVAFCCVQHMA